MLRAQTGGTGGGERLPRQRSSAACEAGRRRWSRASRARVQAAGRGGSGGGTACWTTARHLGCPQQGAPGRVAARRGGTISAPACDGCGETRCPGEGLRRRAGPWRVPLRRRSLSAPIAGLRSPDAGAVGLDGASTAGTGFGHSQPRPGQRHARRRRPPPGLDRHPASPGRRPTRGRRRAWSRGSPAPGGESETPTGSMGWARRGRQPVSKPAMAANSRSVSSP